MSILSALIHFSLLNISLVSQWKWLKRLFTRSPLFISRNPNTKKTENEMFYIYEHWQIVFLCDSRCFFFARLHKFYLSNVVRSSIQSKPFKVAALSYHLYCCLTISSLQSSARLSSSLQSLRLPFWKRAAQHFQSQHWIWFRPWSSADVKCERIIINHSSMLACLCLERFLDFSRTAGEDEDKHSSCFFLGK